MVTVLTLEEWTDAKRNDSCQTFATTAFGSTRLSIAPHTHVHFCPHVCSGVCLSGDL